MKTEKNAAVQTPLTTNKHLIRWVEKMADLCQPAGIHWIDGSEAENDWLCQKLVEGGTFTKLNESFGLDASMRGRRRMMWREWRTEHLSARCRKTTQGRRITGKTRS